MAPPHAPRRFALPFTALVAGAVAMGASPIFVRIADVGPYASAFWRVALALPFFFLWQRQESGRGTRAFARPSLPVLLSGLAFAGDLIFWHLSILNTSIANATLLATMAPVWVFCFAFLLFGQRLRPAEVLGLATCIIGGGLLVGESVQIGAGRLLGDVQALAVSLFFGLYILAVTKARALEGAALVMVQSTAITAVLLLGAAIVSGDHLIPASPRGWMVLAGLALVSQVAGHGLLTFALGRLPVAFSSLIVFLEAVAAAGLGWLLLQESLGFWQWSGGALVLAGIFVARPGTRDEAMKGKGP